MSNPKPAKELDLIKMLDEKVMTTTFGHERSKFTETRIDIDSAVNLYTSIKKLYKTNNDDQILQMQRDAQSLAESLIVKGYHNGHITYHQALELIHDYVALIGEQ